MIYLNPAYEYLVDTGEIQEGYIYLNNPREILEQGEIVILLEAGKLIGFSGLEKLPLSKRTIVSDLRKCYLAVCKSLGVDDFPKDIMESFVVRDIGGVLNIQVLYGSREVANAFKYYWYEEADSVEGMQQLQ